jgi:hypothetical protein
MTLPSLVVGRHRTHSFNQHWTGSFDSYAGHDSSGVVFDNTGEARRLGNAMEGRNASNATAAEWPTAKISGAF